MGYSSISRPSRYSGKGSSSTSSTTSSPATQSEPSATTTPVATSLTEILELVTKSEQIKARITEHERAIISAQGELYQVDTKIKEAIKGLDPSTKAQLKALLETLSASKANDNTK